MRILVVEDDPVTVSALEMVLRAAGHETDHAGNGLGALVRLAAAPLPDAIVLDHLMPAMDGLEFLRELRSGGGGAGAVPVVLITAAGDLTIEPLLAPLRELGPVRLLRKPCEPDEMLEAIREMRGGAT